MVTHVKNLGLSLTSSLALYCCPFQVHSIILTNEMYLWFQCISSNTFNLDLIGQQKSLTTSSS